jgi:hypothetical protein
MEARRPLIVERGQEPFCWLSATLLSFDMPDEADDVA